MKSVLSNVAEAIVPTKMSTALSTMISGRRMAKRRTGR